MHVCYVSVCEYVCVFICVNMHASMNMWKPEEKIMVPLSVVLHFILLRQGLLQNPKLTVLFRLAGQ